MEASIMKTFVMNHIQRVPHMAKIKSQMVEHDIPFTIKAY